MKNFKFLGLMLMALVISASSPVLLPASVQAAPAAFGDPCDKKFPSYDKDLCSGGVNSIEDILKLMNEIFKYFFYVVLTLSSIMLLYAAFKYIWSKGDPTEVETAKNIIIYAVIALIVSGIAYAVPTIILNFVDI